MDRMPHREMRNNSADLLRRVEAGESVIVTNNGRPVAIVSPVGRSALDELAERGHLRPAVRSLDSLRTIDRHHARLSTADMLRDSRSDL